MNIKSQIKNSLITLLIVSWTITTYAALSTVISGDKLGADSWNAVINMVNSHETKISSLSSSWWLDVISVDWPATTCWNSVWTQSTATCPAWYVATWWGCSWVCVNVAHFNSYPASATSYKCDRWTWTQDHARTLTAKAICTKVK